MTDLLPQPTTTPIEYPELTNATGEVWLNGRFAVFLGIPRQTGGFLWDTAEWDTGQWGGSYGWIDVTCDCRGVSIDRGRSNIMNRYDAGTIQIELFNRNNIYSPWNTSSPYMGPIASGIRPGMPVAVAIGYSHPDTGDNYDWVGVYDEENSWDGEVEWRWLFVGTMEALEDDWPGTVDYRVIVHATDTSADLATVSIPKQDVGVRSGEFTGERIGHVLDISEWRWPRDIDNGVVTLRDTMYGKQSIDLIRIAAESDGGITYSRNDGTFTYDDSNWQASPDAVALFSDQCDLVDAAWYVHPYFDAKFVTDTDLLVNWAVVAAEGDTPVTARDNISIGIHGVYDYTKTDLEFQNTAQAQRLADMVVEQRAWMTSRIEAFSVDWLTDHYLFYTLLRLDIHDSVRFQKRVSDTFLYDLQMVVEGWSHSLTPSNWQSTIRTSTILGSSTIHPPIIGEEGWDVGIWEETEWS